MKRYRLDDIVMLARMLSHLVPDWRNAWMYLVKDLIFSDLGVHEVPRFDGHGPVFRSQFNTWPYLSALGIGCFDNITFRLID
jgi:hypothetical protein